MGKKGEETKKLIRERAAFLFTQKGFKNVTMKDICSATDLSRGGLYRRYNRLQGTVVIRKLEQILGKVSSYIVPVVISLLGVFLLSYGGTSLI